MRVISFVNIEVMAEIEGTEVYLLSIYDKSALQNISDSLVESLINEVKDEIKLKQKTNNDEANEFPSEEEIL